MPKEMLVEILVMSGRVSACDCLRFAYGTGFLRIISPGIACTHEEDRNARRPATDRSPRKPSVWLFPHVPFAAVAT